MVPLRHRLGFWLLKPFLIDLMLTLHSENRLIAEKINNHKGVSKWAKKEFLAHIAYVQLGLQAKLTKFYGFKWTTIEKE